MIFLLQYLNPLTVIKGIYVLQRLEYDTRNYLDRVLNPKSIAALKQYRGRLSLTGRVVLSIIILLFCYFGYIYTILNKVHPLSIAFFILVAGFVLSGLFFLAAINFIIEIFVAAPLKRHKIALASVKLSRIEATRIAVLGSYGKTTMKEMLLTVLGEKYQVSATPGNRNVLVSHASWVQGVVTDSDEVLIFEYGEGAPGDIRRLANFSKPNRAVVCGVSPAHLDKYRTIDNIVADFRTISDFVSSECIYFNQECPELINFSEGSIGYSASGGGSVSVESVKVGYEGTTFELRIGSKNKRAVFTSGLVGKHHVGPMVAVIIMSLDMGLSIEEIQTGLSKVSPHEHRMHPRFEHGAWIIDDTYNGNINGLKAGLDLLHDLPAKRKIYMTPGLVDQGDLTKSVHTELGAYIAQKNPDKVVLVQNSVTHHILEGINNSNYKGEVQIISDPLMFYQSLSLFLATGDLLLLQNDWPDEYK